MTLHQLKIFDTVVKHLNITRAAREINISQPTVSKQFKLLEKEFGVKFHLNLGQGIRLTEEGRMFWNAIQPILHQVEDLKNIFPNREKQPGARLFTLGCSESPAVSLLPKILKAFQQSHPNVYPIVRAGTSHVVEQMLLDSVIEIALITDPSEHSQIIVEPIISRKAIAVVSARDPLAKKGKMHDEDLANTPLIVRVESRIVKQLKQTGLKLNIVMECESSHAVISAVETCSGIGVVHKDFVELALRRGYLKPVLIPCLKNIEVKIFTAYRKGALLSQNAEDFRALSQRWRTQEE